MPIPTPSRYAWLALALAVLALLAWPERAQASGDIGCAASWRLSHGEFTGCDSMVMLSPGNDTRVNLALLLARGPGRVVSASKDDRRPDPLFDWAAFARWTYPAPPEVGDAGYAAGEGSRCLGDAAGAAAFMREVAATRQLSARERTMLVAARRALRPTCTAAPPGPAVAIDVKSAMAKQFVAYLAGAGAFYAGDFDAATARFASLTDSGQPWLRETARYMLGRVEVNRAQIGAFDDYGYRDAQHKADAAVIARAEARFRDYLTAYPNGRYAASARGLLRRVHWLGGDTAKLAAAYAALFALPPGARGIDDADLAQEIDNKLLSHLTATDTDDPILLAVLDLRAMRRGGDRAAAITPVDIEQQRPKFARAPALLDYLRAAHAFYVAGDQRAVTRLIPDAARQTAFDSLSFSRQMLRGMALDALKDGNARGFWLDLLPGATPPLQRTTVELALALHDERTAGLDRVFAAGSPIRDPVIRDLLLTNVAGPILLRRQAADRSVTAHERAVALFVLLYKGLGHGAYADFVRDLAAVPAGAPVEADTFEFVGAGNPPIGLFTNGKTADAFACPALRDTAQRLAREPANATAQLCVAEFVRLNNLDGYFLDTQPPADELGGTRSQFPGRPFSRLETYKIVIAAPRIAAGDRAYALFRAINCYAPSRINSCGGADVPTSVRKGWFRRLHEEYAASRWAQELEYYW